MPGAGAPNADATLVALTAYNNATNRLNIFNQTNFVYSMFTGKIRHTFLGGIELGGQFTDNFRNTGYFNNTATSINVPFQNPLTTTPVTLAAECDGRRTITCWDQSSGAAYVQDQIEISKYVQVVAGVRFDQFDLNYTDNRTPAQYRRIDNLGSPRVGQRSYSNRSSPLSLYYKLHTISYLPSSGDQFSSLTNNHRANEAGKVHEQRMGAQKLKRLSRRLRRDRVRSIAWIAPTPVRRRPQQSGRRSFKTGSTRTNGVELGVNGNIMRANGQVAGGYAYQDAFISSATAAAKLGAQVGQVPHHTFSLWNNYSITKRFGALVWNHQSLRLRL